MKERRRTGARSEAHQTAVASLPSQTAWTLSFSLSLCRSGWSGMWCETTGGTVTALSLVERDPSVAPVEPVRRLRDQIEGI